MIWVFENCVLDADRRELSRDGQLVSVEPQVFDVLVHLIRNRAHVVTKDALIDSVWSGRIVSDSALANRINAARAAVRDNGEQQRLIRTLPRKGFRFVGDVVETGSTRGPDVVQIESNPTAPKVLALPDQPSIVVLPFANLGPDEDSGHFADGMTEDLITELARIRWLFVIARNSSFVYKHRVGDLQQVSRELGVRYVLDGSVRRSGQRLRINARLVDATTGVHHWAEQYDKTVGEFFAVQDEITNSVTAAVEPHLLVAEGGRVTLRATADLGSWELTARAQSQSWRLTKLDYEGAIETLKHAIEVNPNYPPAQALLGFCLVFAVHMGWLAKEPHVAVGRQHAERAIGLDDRNPWGHSALGYAAMMQHRTGESVAAFRSAVKLNPSSAAAHSHLSHGLAFAGQSDDAIEHASLAIRLSPLDPEMARFFSGLAIAHFAARRFEQALQFTSEQLRLRPDFRGALRLHCASLAHAGRIDDARASLAGLQREQPDLSIDWIRQNVPYQTPVLIDLFIEGLRKAGLNE